MIDKLRPLPVRVKVMFVSGYTDDALAEHGVLDPTIAFLEKPFSPARQTQKIRQVIASTTKGAAPL